MPAEAHRPDRQRRAVGHPRRAQPGGTATPLAAPRDELDLRVEVQPVRDVDRAGPHLAADPREQARRYAWSTTRYHACTRPIRTRRRPKPGDSPSRQLRREPPSSSLCGSMTCESHAARDTAPARGRRVRDDRTPRRVRLGHVRFRRRPHPSEPGERRRVGGPLHVLDAVHGADRRRRLLLARRRRGRRLRRIAGRHALRVRRRCEHQLLAGDRRVRSAVDRADRRSDPRVTRRRRRRRLRGFGRSQVLRVRRGRHRELLGDAQDMPSAVDRDDRQQGADVTRGIGRRRLRRCRRRPALRVRRDRHGQLRGDPQDLHAAVDRRPRSTGELLTRGQWRCRVHRLGRPQPLRDRRGGYHQLLAARRRPACRCGPRTWAASCSRRPR